MAIKRKWGSGERWFKIGPVFLVVILMFFSCASSPRKFDSKVQGPQMIVEPDSIRLGIARMKGTEIVFRGKGFQPGDSVFIQLLGTEKETKGVNIPIADGDVDGQGYFNAKVGLLVKVSELLRAKIGSNEKMETIIIVTHPPIPEGIYRAKAVSMESDITAECKLEVKGPSLLDRLKDWIGGLLGKIVKK